MVKTSEMSMELKQELAFTKEELAELEACRHSYDEGHTPVEHLVYASSSSVCKEK